MWYIYDKVIDFYYYDNDGEMAICNHFDSINGFKTLEDVISFVKFNSHIIIKKRSDFLITRGELNSSSAILKIVELTDYKQ